MFHGFELLSTETRDTICTYMYLFKRLMAVLAARFYRFAHIVAYNSGKVVAKLGSVRHFPQENKS